MKLQELKEKYKNSSMDELEDAVNNKLEYKEYDRLEGHGIKEKTKVLYNQMHNNMEHKITTENILKAAEKCPQAKETLKTMFPEAFEKDEVIMNYKKDALWVGDNCIISISPNKINLNNRLFKWEIINPLNTTSVDTILIPTRK